MARYHTEQRRLLYAFFQAHPHEQFSAKDIYEALGEADISISAVYRNLGAMKEEGLLRCEVHEGSRDTLYQFMDGQHCADAIHLTCVDCGKTFHMRAEAARAIQSELAEMEGFRINKVKTILYGTCKNCMGHV